MIKFENVSKSYGEKKAVSSLSFEIGECEKAAIVGESGAGKTTVLRLISFLEKADSGIISGYSPNDVSFMFQEARLFPQLDLLRNVSCVGRVNRKENEEKAKKLLSLFDLEDDLYKKPSELSGGMQRKCALARLMMTEKPIVLLDEPFESLDEKSRDKARRIISEYASDKLLILVSHNSADVEYLCKDRIIRL